MERLTEKRNGKNVIPLRNAACGVDTPYWMVSRANELEAFLYGAAADKLAAYEDAEEQGRLVILPCKVGDTAYIIWDSDIYPENPPAVREDHITQVKFTTKGYAFKTWRGWYHKSDIGKTVFLTREEAEAALKGGQDE